LSYVVKGSSIILSSYLNSVRLMLSKCFFVSSSEASMNFSASYILAWLTLLISSSFSAKGSNGLDSSSDLDSESPELPSYSVFEGLAS